MMYKPILSQLLSELERTTRVRHDIHDQHYGLNVNPTLQHLEVVPHLTGYIRPWRHLDLQQSGTSNVVDNKDSLKISLNVEHFKPDELSVKVVDDFIVIQGKHEERSDEHGLVSRHFTRRYFLPKDVNDEAIESSLSSDGILQLTVPKKTVKNTSERVIPITTVNQPASPFPSPKPPAEKRPRLEMEVGA